MVPRDRIKGNGQNYRKFYLNRNFFQLGRGGWRGVVVGGSCGGGGGVGHGKKLPSEAEKSSQMVLKTNQERPTISLL